MQPDPTLTREIRTVRPEQIALTDNNLHDAYSVLIRQQSQSLARALAHAEALTTERDQLREQNTALKTLVSEMKAGAVDEVSAKRKTG